jgi:hypothetical protein
MTIPNYIVRRHNMKVFSILHNIPREIPNTKTPNNAIDSDSSHDVSIKSMLGFLSMELCDGRVCKLNS